MRELLYLPEARERYPEHAVQVQRCSIGYLHLNRPLISLDIQRGGGHSQGSKAALAAVHTLHSHTTIATHRVGAVHDEPLQQDARDLLLDHLRLRLGEQVEQHAAEVVRVLVGVPELVCHRVQEEVAPLGVELVGELPSS